MFRRAVRSGKERLQKAARAALSEGLYRLGAWRFLVDRFAGCGVVFALHHAHAQGEKVLSPGMSCSAKLLDDVLRLARRLGWDVVSLDEVRRRLLEGDPNRFVSFTFDDGYADSLTVALPVFRKHEAPFAVYISTDLVDRTLDYWWGGLERLIQSNDSIVIETEAGPRCFTARTWEEKKRCLDALDAWAHHGDLLSRLPGVFRRYGIDVARELDSAALTWEQARELACDPLVTIGGHTQSHPRLRKLTLAEAHIEMAAGRARLEAELSIPVDHFAYPYGGLDSCGHREFELARKLGFKTAVTTIRDNLFPQHRDQLTALPRRVLYDGRSTRPVRNLLVGLASRIRKSAG